LLAAAIGYDFGTSTLLTRSCFAAFHKVKQLAFDHLIKKVLIKYHVDPELVALELKQ
jgi:hypothetical protein